MIRSGESPGVFKRPHFFRKCRPIRPGQVGQYVDVDVPFSFVGKTGGSDRLFWPIDELGTPALDWADGDGVNPYVGPTFTVTGAPSIGQPTPWQYEGGAPVTAADFDINEYYKTVTVLDPSINDDIVILFLAGPIFDNSVASTFFSNRLSGAGFTLFQSTNGDINFTLADATSSVTSGVGMSHGWNVFGVTVNRGVIQYLYLGGRLDDSDDISGIGSVASGQGFSINALLDGSESRSMSISRLVVWYGVGLADIATADWHLKVASVLLGFCPRQGPLIESNRNSLAVGKAGSNWFIFGKNAPRSGNEKGVVVSGTRTNLVYNNINTQSVTGWNSTGGTISVVSDETQLATDGMKSFGPYVVKFVSGASDQILYGGAQTGNTNTHSISVFLRGLTGGESVDIGLRSAGTGTFTAFDTVTLTTSWQRFIISTIVPASSDSVFALDCDAGDEILVVLGQLEAGITATMPIPNWSSSSSSIRAHDYLFMESLLRDSEGSLHSVITPSGWSRTTPDLGAARIFREAGGLIIYGTASGWRFHDGVTIPLSGEPTDGVESYVTSRWYDDIHSIEETGFVRGVDTYDGTLIGTGKPYFVFYVIVSSHEYIIRAFCICRNGRD